MCIRKNYNGQTTFEYIYRGINFRIYNYKIIVLRVYKDGEYAIKRPS